VGSPGGFGVAIAWGLQRIAQVDGWFEGWSHGMNADREPMNLAAYVQRIRTSPCFVCGIVRGDAEYDHEEVVFEDDAHIAFLASHPTVYGRVLVAPKDHVEHVVGELSQEAFLALLAVVHRVARAIEQVVPSERTYLLSLGSQQAVAHVHWHIAPLPPGTPFERQQFHALMMEHGVIPWSPAQAAELAGRLRAVLAAGTSATD
jgi:diadenosine tetraphosphate (Ap4A) HIT family hydrolase